MIIIFVTNITSSINVYSNKLSWFHQYANYQNIRVNVNQHVFNACNTNLQQHLSLNASHNVSFMDVFQNLLATYANPSIIYFPFLLLNCNLLFFFFFIYFFLFFSFFFFFYSSSSSTRTLLLRFQASLLLLLSIIIIYSYLSLFTATCFFLSITSMASVTLFSIFIYLCIYYLYLFYPQCSLVNNS